MLDVLAALHTEPVTPMEPERLSVAVPVLAGWPVELQEARNRQAALGPVRRTLDLGEGVRMELVRSYNFV